MLFINIHEHFGSLRHVFLVGAHKMCNECFQVKYLLASKLHSELIQASEAQSFRLYVDVAAFREDLNEAFEDDVWGNSLRQELIQSITNLFQPLRCLLKKNLVCCFF